MGPPMQVLGREKIFGSTADIVGDRLEFGGLCRVQKDVTGGQVERLNSRIVEPAAVRGSTSIR